jgi:hypothetical protein
MRTSTCSRVGTHAASIAPSHCTVCQGDGWTVRANTANLMPLAVEISREEVPDLSIAARENNAKRPAHGIASAVVSSA